MSAEQPGSSRSRAKNVTLQDIAADASVSRSTVSNVLRNSPLVAEATRERVLRSIQKLGYVYNRGAASLRTQKSNTIGLVIPNIRNPFFADLTVGVEEQLEKAGYVALLGNTSLSPKKQDRVLETMQEHQTDGILLCPTPGTSPDLVKRFQKQGPLVILLDRLPDMITDFVGVDNVAGAELAVEQLINRGHRRIAFIGGQSNSPVREERLLGYRKKLGSHRIPIDPMLIVAGISSGNYGYKTIHTLLQLPNPPTAALCFRTTIAFGVMSGLRAHGIMPGRDFAVIGFDDLDEAALWQPAVTTVSIEQHQVGKVAARLLLERISDPTLPLREVIVPARLVIRESCGTRSASNPNAILPL